MAKCHMDLHGFSLTVSMDRCHSENPGCDAVKRRSHAVCCVSSRRKVDIRYSMTFLMFHSILVDSCGTEKGWQHPCCVETLLQWVGAASISLGNFDFSWGLHIARCADFWLLLLQSQMLQAETTGFAMFSHFIIILSFFWPYIIYCSKLITSFNVLQC